MERLVPCGDTIGTVPRVLPEKQSVIPGGCHQNIWRDQFQACTGIVVQPAVKVLGP